MKYFDKLTDSVSEAFSNRAVDIEKLKYCVKADLDHDGCYYDVYITYDEEKLYLLSGYDKLITKRRKSEAGRHYGNECPNRYGGLQAGCLWNGLGRGDPGRQRQPGAGEPCSSADPVAQICNGTV